MRRHASQERISPDQVGLEILGGNTGRWGSDRGSGLGNGGWMRQETGTRDHGGIRHIQYIDTRCRSSIFSRPSSRGVGEARSSFYILKRNITRPTARCDPVTGVRREKKSKVPVARNGRGSPSVPTFFFLVVVIVLLANWGGGLCFFYACSGRGEGAGSWANANGFITTAASALDARPIERRKQSGASRCPSHPALRCPDFPLGSVHAGPEPRPRKQVFMV